MKKPTRVALVASDYPDLEKFCPNFNGMRRGFEKLSVDYRFVSARPSLDVAAIIDYEPDLVVYCLMEILYNRAACDEIRTRLPNATIVFWYGDYRNDITGHHNGDYSKLIDVMFVSNDAQEEFWRGHLRIPIVHYLPLGCTPLDTPLYSKKFDMPFVFVGGMNGAKAFADRMLFVKELLECTDLKIISSYEFEMRKKVFEAMPTIYSSARVVLDVSHFTDVQGYTSNRYFIIPAFFGLPITKRFPGCEELYPSSIRPYFDTIDEAIELRDFYVGNPTEREKTVRLLHDYSHNHSYDKRWEQMFKLL